MHWLRFSAVVALLAMTGWAALELRTHGPSGVAFLPGCQFRRFTGLECPGCGMTRATYAMLHGHLAEAFRFNPLGMVLMPLACAGLMLEAAAWVVKKPFPWRLRPGAKAGRAIVWSLMVFWALRNFPWWPWG